MESLMEVSHEGDTGGLYAAIRENPNILAQIDEIPFADTPLHASASAGHIQYSMEIMKLKPSFATKLNPDGFTPIHLALRNRHVQLVIRLVEKNNDLVRVKGREDTTPLHYAVETGNIALMARFLFVSPKSVEDVNVRNETALHIALRYEMFEAFEFLVGRLQLNYHEEAYYLKKRIINWMDEEGNTILHIATFKKQLQLVRLLVRCKVDINANNVEGRTALDYVQDENAIEFSDLLCSAGAVGASSIPIVDYSALMLRTDQRLKMAAELGDINALYSTIEEDPCILDRIDQTPLLNTPLHIAASNGHTNFALEIRRLKPSFGRKLNQEGLSPLHLAIYKENSQTAIRLIDEDGHLVRVKGTMGKTPLHIAAEQGELDLLVACLTACPASIEDVTDNKETALHIALKNDKIEALRTIFGWLEYAGKRMVLTWADYEGNTVLHIACLKNQMEVVRLLTSDLSLWTYLIHILSSSVFALSSSTRIYVSFAGPNISMIFLDSGREDSGAILWSLKNSQGLTAIDILLEQGPIPILKIKVMQLFSSANVKIIDYGSAEYLKKTISTFDKNVIRSIHTNLLISDEHRAAVITVAVLIATATYQAILSPPRGLWQGDPTLVFSDGTNISNPSATVQNNTVHNMVGTSVMSVTQWSWFSILNTAAFLASVLKINGLLSGRSINIIYLVFPLVICYIVAICSISPPDHIASITRIIVIISILSGLLYTREVHKELSIIRCKRVIKTLQLRHRPDECT